MLRFWRSSTVPRFRKTRTTRSAAPRQIGTLAQRCFSCMLPRRLGFVYLRSICHVRRSTTSPMRPQDPGAAHWSSLETRRRACDSARRLSSPPSSGPLQKVVVELRVSSCLLSALTGGQCVRHTRRGDVRDVSRSPLRTAHVPWSHFLRNANSTF